jgi:hypothetical protein
MEKARKDLSRGVAALHFTALGIPCSVPAPELLISLSSRSRRTT